MKVSVIGAGLAGCESAHYLANKGFHVTLYEMRPMVQTPIHKTDLFAELVCSNSLKSYMLDTASGLLKEEMKCFGSLVLEAALISRVMAGSALAVDRTTFSEYITQKIANHPNITIIRDEVKKIPEGYCIIATGPLSSPIITKEFQEMFGLDNLSFFDAAAPIVYADSLDYSKVYLKSRYDKGEAAYLNCPMTKEEFTVFYNELINGKRVILHDFEVFEGCMPVEVMAKRGEKTLLFGPLRPVGLDNGSKPYAVVQLREDDALKSLYNLVGFQTNLTFGEQKRIFSLIPGLENARFAKYGVMHQNIYLNSPHILNCFFQSKSNNQHFFAGQLTGVEGYMESAASGILAAVFLCKEMNKVKMCPLPNTTILGALASYITLAKTNFQPMNANFGILPPLDIKGKKKRIEEYVRRSMTDLKEWLNE